MKIINLMQYDVVVINEQKEIIETIPRSMKVAYLDSDKERYPETIGKQIYKDHPIPFFIEKYKIPYLIKVDEQGRELKRLQFPSKVDGIIYIVCPVFLVGYYRSDLWQPAEAKYNDQLIRCTGLSQ